MVISPRLVFLHMAGSWAGNCFPSSVLGSPFKHLTLQNLQVVSSNDPVAGCGMNGSLLQRWCQRCFMVLCIEGVGFFRKAFSVHVSHNLNALNGVI